METKKKKRKLLSAVVAVGVSAVILLTGTFAWQSISQMALNETQDAVNPGARLHDDFDGRNKDVYVENFMTEAEGGVPIYARVRLDEYMEIGAGAGLKTGEDGYDSKEAQSVVGGADINNVSTWKTHIPGADSTDDPFHEYWTWDMDGNTVYLPTFNKNKDSLAADINGTYDGESADDDLHYDDYKTYTLGERVTDDEIYDNDPNDIDEGAGAIDPDNITTVRDQQHTAAMTMNSTVMTMQEWLDAGAQPGPYWVYDEDGWAYWAQAIQPGTATGLLLDGITLQKEPDADWYYSINAVGQFATIGDWGSEAGKDGFFGENDGPAPTENALFLLNQAAYGLTVTVSADGNATTVQAGEPLQFTAKVTAGTVDALKADVSWAVSGNTSGDTSIDAGGLLTVGADEAEGVLTVTATSKADGAAAGVYRITVEAAELP